MRAHVRACARVCVRVRVRARARARACARGRPPVWHGSGPRRPILWQLFHPLLATARLTWAARGFLRLALVLAARLASIAFRS
eukprot:11408796-Alexandrium_andersonii.AAC.1